MVSPNLQELKQAILAQNSSDRPAISHPCDVQLDLFSHGAMKIHCHHLIHSFQLIKVKS